MATESDIDDSSYKINFDNLKDDVDTNWWWS